MGSCQITEEKTPIFVTRNVVQIKIYWPSLWLEDQDQIYTYTQIENQRCQFSHARYPLFRKVFRNKVSILFFRAMNSTTVISQFSIINSVETKEWVGGGFALIYSQPSLQG